MRDDEGVGLKLNRPELFLFVFEFIIPGTLAVPYVFFFFFKKSNIFILGHDKADQP